MWPGPTILADAAWRQVVMARYARRENGPGGRIRARAARALLGWKQHNLAKAAKIGIATIRRIEGQEGRGCVSTLMHIQSAFEQAGIRFLDSDVEGGIGVRLEAPKP